jgi:dihydropteroate synthase
MHMRGTPQSMQQLTDYENVVEEVYAFLAQKILELEDLGIQDIVVDPGFGFSKTIEQNYTLLRHFDRFTALQKPLLAGLSRKSMIYKKLNISAQEALPGTLALNTLALDRGADILRVHDVQEHVDLVKLFS